MEKIDRKENLIRLINQYQNLIFSICLKFTGDYFTAEDITQETFISAYENEASFAGGSEKAWLCRIASNRCIDYQRAAARRTVIATEEQFQDIVVSEQQEPLNKEILEELEKRCRALPETYREVAELYFIRARSAKEISDSLKLSIKTVQTRIYRARELLRKQYDRKELISHDE